MIYVFSIRPNNVVFSFSLQEEFEGFTSEEIAIAEAKYIRILGPKHGGSPSRVLPGRRPLRPREGLRERAPLVTPAKQVSTSTATEVDSQTLPEDTSTRITRGRVTLRRIQEKLFKKGLAKPMKLSVTAKVHQLEKKRKEKEAARVQKQKEKEEKLAKRAKERELKRQSVKLRPIKIRLGSDGNQAKIVRGPGRPSIYDKETGLKSGSDAPPPTDVEEEEEALKKRTRRVHFKDEEPVTTRLRGRKPKVCVVPQSKRVDKSVAKQLLAKAKKGKPGRLGKSAPAETIALAEDAGSRKGKAQKVEKTVEETVETVEESNTEKAKPALISPPRPRGSGFVLPTVSSRSSRKIIPNKRFIESSDIYYSSGKSRNSLSGSTTKSETPTPPPAPPTTPPAPPKAQQKKTEVAPAAATAVSPVIIDDDDDDDDEYVDVEEEESGVQSSGMVTPTSSPSKGDPQLQTSPLIVAGKRDRRPSQKLIQKLSDDDALSILNRKMEMKKKGEDKKKPAVSPDKSMKMSKSNIDQLIAAGFSHGEIERQKEPRRRATEMLMERTAEATRRSGQNILRKAKLQLNRAALNRSKLALARSLKREMKREEKKLARQKATEQLSVKTVGFGGFRSQPMSNMQLSPLKLTGFGQQGLGSAISQGELLVLC